MKSFSWKRFSSIFYYLFYYDKKWACIIKMKTQRKFISFYSLCSLCAMNITHIHFIIRIKFKFIMKYKLQNVHKPNWTDPSASTSYNSIIKKLWKQKWCGALLYVFFLTLILCFMFSSAFCRRRAWTFGEGSHNIGVHRCWC